MSKRLTPEDMETLRQIFGARRSELTIHLDRLGTQPLPNEAYDDMQSALGDELVETGLGPDDEPNARGLMLEGLIDKIGRIRDGR